MKNHGRAGQGRAGGLPQEHLHLEGKGASKELEISSPRGRSLFNKEAMAFDKEEEQNI